MAARAERRSFWTWGYVSDEPSLADRRAAAKRLAERIGEVVEPPPVPAIEDIALPASRLEVACSLGGVGVDKRPRSVSPTPTGATRWNC